MSMSGSSRSSTSLRTRGVEQVRFSTSLKSKLARACNQLRVASMAGPPPALHAVRMSAAANSSHITRAVVFDFIDWTLADRLTRWAHHPLAVFLDHVNLLIEVLALLHLPGDHLQAGIQIGI